MFLKLKRVNYGKKDTPEKDREYRIHEIPESPVGTLDEIVKFIETNDYLKRTVSGLNIFDPISNDYRLIIL